MAAYGRACSDMQVFCCKLPLGLLVSLHMLVMQHCSLSKLANLKLYCACAVISERQGCRL